MGDREPRKVLPVGHSAVQLAGNMAGRDRLPFSFGSIVQWTRTAGSYPADQSSTLCGPTVSQRQTIRFTGWEIRASKVQKVSTPHS